MDVPALRRRRRGDWRERREGGVMVSDVCVEVDKMWREIGKADLS